MKKEEYEHIQNHILMFAELTKTLDLAGFLNKINHCETVAPVIDPTLWMKGNKNLQFIKKTAEALYEAQKRLP